VAAKTAAAARKLAWTRQPELAKNNRSQICEKKIQAFCPNLFNDCGVGGLNEAGKISKLKMKMKVM